MNHCFISYSNGDADDFGPQLALELEAGHYFVEAWFDKRDIKPGNTWDEKVPEAIKNCKCLLFVMTKDSVAENSICFDEWDLALKYKKPILVLRLHKDTEPPFRLGKRQWIDFTNNRKAGMAKLLLAIQHLDKPEGQLEILKDRLADAERDLVRGKQDDKPRIQAEIEQLKTDIQALEKVVANPEAAQEQTQKNIEAGLERERQPEKPVAGKTSTRFINPPPGLAPNYFQDRLIETKQIVDFLNNDSKRLMTVVGRAGVGKTAIICRLLKGIESGQLPDDLGEMKADGIIYLSEAGSHRIKFANIFADLSKLLSNEVSSKLESLYKNPQISTVDKMRALLDAFSYGRIILLLDNFEDLVDSERLNVKDSELSDALNALLYAPQHTVKVIITTRIAPRDLALVEPGRQRPLNLDEGLESPYAENVLREMDADGRVGLKPAPDVLLNKAREKTRGYPRALEALYAILSVDRYTTLEELLELSLPEEVVQKLVGEAFNRLDPSAQKVMQALAVYNRPVSPAAIDYLLQPHLPSIDSALVLNRLVNMHFARREAGRYYLHPADKEYAFSIIPEGERTLEELEKPDFNFEETDSEEQIEITEEEVENDNEEKTSDVNIDDIDFESLLRSYKKSRTDFTRYGLLDRAADYFAQARKPRAEWKKLDDLAAQLAELELRCEAGDYDTAAHILLEFDCDYLLLWGHNRLMIDLHKKLQGKIKDPNLSRRNIGNLGQALIEIGKVKQSIINYEKALTMAKEAKNRQAESVWLGNLGGSYYLLGDIQKAIECYEEQFTITQEINDKQGESNADWGLGISYVNLGDIPRAFEYFMKHLDLVREIGDKFGEGNALNNLGGAYEDLGNVSKAIDFFEQALLITREIGDRRGEESSLENLGNCYSELGDISKAIEFYEQALVINREIGKRRGECSTLDNFGYAFLNLGDFKNAIDNFNSAISIADEIDQSSTQCIARCGIAHVYLFQNDLVNARATTEEALQYDVPEHNHSASALHGIIALRQGERETAQEAFTKSIAQADEILARTPDYYSALDAKGLALSGLGICDLRLTIGRREELLAEAVKTFKRAREIAPHAGVVKSVLRLFDELVKCDEEGLLKGVREVIEAKPLVE